MLGSPHVDIAAGDVISYVTEKMVVVGYGCGDTCVDMLSCSGYSWSYKGDIIDYLKTRGPKSCVLSSTGVLEFTEKYDEIAQEIERSCVEIFTDYYSRLLASWRVARILGRPE